MDQDITALPVEMDQDITALPAGMGQDTVALPVGMAAAKQTAMVIVCLVMEKEIASRN